LHHAALGAAFVFVVGSSLALGTGANAAEWKVRIGSPGLFRLDAAAATALGHQGGLNSLGVRSRGRDIPVQIADDGSALWLYAEPDPTLYSSTTTYWLSDAAPPAPWPIRPAAPPTGTEPTTVFRCVQREEVQAYYFQQMPNGEGKDHWFWKPVMLKQPVDLPFKCARLAAGPAARLSVSLHGVSYLPPKPDHHISFALNGAALGEVTFDGQAPYVFEAEVPAGVLREGDNTLTVAAVEDTVRELDLVLVDYFVVEYPRALIADGDALRFTLGPDVAVARVSGFTSPDVIILDVTDPLAPVALADTQLAAADGGFAVTFAPQARAEGSRYLAIARSAAVGLPEATLDEPSALKAPDNRADYVIVAPREFLDAAQPLVELHQAEGLAVKAVAVEDIYDEFSNGDFTPVAIRDFLAHAVKTWATPAPRFVLMIGDATYDYQDYRGRGERSYVPTYMAETDPHGQVASDNFFACIEGDDLAPDLAIGRISARTPQDVAAAVERIRRYVGGAGRGEWEKRALLVADDDEPQFEKDCENAAALLEAAGLSTTRLYLRSQPSEKAMTEALLTSLAEGNLLTIFVGHGEPRSWTHEQVLKAEHLESLQWSDSFTFVVTLTCLDGGFEMNPEPCMAELFMLPPVGGAIACFSPTGLGYPDQHDVLAQALLRGLLKPDATIGEAVMAAKRAALAARRDLAALVQMYILFGDPALRLRVGGANA
jgi:hypothetical protein